MNHYPHHIGDFNNATRHLTRIERSIYSDMIDLYYDTEQPLPADHKKLARRLLVVSPEEVEAMQSVLDEFFTLGDDGYRNDRCDREIAAYREKSEKASNSAKARWSKDRTEPAKQPESKDDANALPTQSESNANQNQNQNQYIPPTPQGGDEDEIPAGWKADSRKSSAMTLDWEPDPKTLGAYLSGKAAKGRPVTAADVRAWLPDWRQSANASGKTMTDAQWTLRLVKYVMACMTSDGATPTNRRASAPQEDPLAFSEENRPEHGPYALFKPGPKKTPMTDEGRARVEQLRRQAFGDAA